MVGTGGSWNLLVVGGAGYVGGATVAHLLDRGHRVWILDDLSTGHRALVQRLKPAGFFEGRAGDRALLDRIFAETRFDGVFHFAARSLVGESVRKPREYFENNVEQTRGLLEAMGAHGVKRFVFSSTCAVFGEPPAGVERLSEDLPKRPKNPYGETKLQVERDLERLARENGLQAVALRYFNAAGSEARLRSGEWHMQETHLIPRVLHAARAGRPVLVFGDDYPTPDGTCVRDYVHVSDLARAHEAAFARLMKMPAAGSFEAFHLGSERGYSVLEVVREAARLLGRQLQIEKRPRRPGDPARLVADSSRAQRELGFRASAGLDEILASALRWEGERRGFARRAVFLDRDGTMNVDPGYLSDPSQLELLPGVARAVAKLKGAGYLVMVVSNQSGVARGRIKPEALPRIHARMDELLAAEGGVALDRYAYCTHLPEADCECRKPKPQLLWDLAQEYGVDLGSSFMVGDKASDLQVGREAGCLASILVRTGEGQHTERTHGPEADFIAVGLEPAADWILKRGNGAP